MIYSTTQDNAVDSINAVIQRATVYAVIICMIAVLLFAITKYYRRLINDTVSYFFPVFCILWLIAIIYAPLWSVLSIVIILGCKGLWKRLKSRDRTIIECLVCASENSVPRALYMTYIILMLIGLMDIVSYILSFDGSEDVVDLYYYPVLLARCPVTSITSMGIVIVSVVSLLFCIFSKYLFLTDVDLQIMRDEQEECVRIQSAYDDEESNI